MKKSKGDYTGIQNYTRKTAKINFKDPTLTKPLPGKSYAPSAILPDIASALLLGKRSAREISKHHKNTRYKLGLTKALSRSTIGDLLNEERTSAKLQKDLLSIFMVANNLRILTTFPKTGCIVALIDGIDWGKVHEGDGHCEYCLERIVDGKITYFHRLVVLSVVSKYGAMPIYFRFCRMKEITVDPKKVSEAKFKEEGELSCAKEMMIEIAGKFGGRLPFDVVASDALMANAPFMELIEALGSAGIFIFKQENRKLFKQAKSDFCGNSFGFNIMKEHWGQDPSNKGRTFDSQWSTYIDLNRKGENKNVKIFETTRKETDGSTSTTLSIASDRAFITPSLVEIARYQKWRSLENGVFNELTNNWNTFKHIFFHKKYAFISMITLIFIIFIVSNFYRYGNLTRGNRRFQGTLRDFFETMQSTFNSLRSKTLLNIRCQSP